MNRLPLLGRLNLREYFALIVGFAILAFESLIRAVVLLLPKPVISWFYRHSKNLFHSGVARTPPNNSCAGAPTSISTVEKFRYGTKSPKKAKISERILHARDFDALCSIFGYTCEEHVVLTKDGYLLGLHRLPSKKGDRRRSPGTSTGKPVVYLHHGLLMNSEVWVCLTDEERCLPFVLVEQGFDVWLGNNRGNKYSKKSIHHSPNSTKFWDFSIDDFAWHDIPDTIQYVLNATGAHSLGYVGFSQGTAQAFAALSIHPQLNAKVNVFIALAPAMSPAGLTAPVVDALMKANPRFLYLIFGRKSILSSTILWQTLLYPPIFASIIDRSLKFLFEWKSANITQPQKVAAYAHLFSFASTKAVVHWFQIMRCGAFTMFDDDDTGGFSDRAYRPARFPTRNIMSPVVLMYGDCDSLVNLKAMLKALPGHTVVRRLRTYEHVDILWGKNVHRDVIPGVLEELNRYKKAENGETWVSKTNNNPVDRGGGHKEGGDDDDEPVRRQLMSDGEAGEESEGDLRGEFSEDFE